MYIPSDLIYLSIYLSAWSDFFDTFYYTFLITPPSYQYRALLMKSFSDIVAGEDWRSQEMINDGEEQMMIMGDETLTNIQKGSKKLNDVIVAEMETMVRDRERRRRRR